MISGTTYMRTWYIYQHFRFDFPFDEIYRRLLFFTLGRMYHTSWCQVRIMYQMRMIPGTYVSLFFYSLVGGGTHHTYVPPKKQLYRYCLFVSGWWYDTNFPPVDAHIRRKLHLSAVARCSDSYCISFILCFFSLFFSLSVYRALVEKTNSVMASPVAG